jgi:hypothetical protein
MYTNPQNHEDFLESFERWSSNEEEKYSSEESLTFRNETSLQSSEVEGEINTYTNFRMEETEYLDLTRSYYPPFLPISPEMEEPSFLSSMDALSSQDNSIQLNSIHSNEKHAENTLPLYTPPSPKLIPHSNPLKIQISSIGDGKISCLSESNLIRISNSGIYQGPADPPSEAQIELTIKNDYNNFSKSNSETQQNVNIPNHLLCSALKDKSSDGKLCLHESDTGNENTSTQEFDYDSTYVVNEEPEDCPDEDVSETQTKIDKQVETALTPRGDVPSEGEGKLTCMFRSFETRNVAKSVLRNTLNYAKRNKRSLKLLLLEKGFSQREVDEVQKELQKLKEGEKKTSTSHNYKKTLNKMMIKNSPYLEVLVQTLQQKISLYKNNRMGRVSQKNRDIYLTGYIDLYKEVLRYLE